MAKALSLIELDKDATFTPDWLKMLSYGKCQTSPYSESNLWFVSFPVYENDTNELIKKYGIGLHEKFSNFEDVTFLVSESYCQAENFHQFQVDVKAWENVAHKVFIGKWCPKFEKLWKDVTIYEVQVEESSNYDEKSTATFKRPVSGLNLITVKYGYCRTTKNQRDLWFISFKDNEKNYDHTFIVDEICTTPNFINYLGNSRDKWEPLCFCYLRDEVKWDNLKTGLDGKGLERFQLDSPYSIDEINENIQFYQHEMSR